MRVFFDFISHVRVGFLFGMYKSGLTQLIRWKLRTGIPRRAGVEGQLLFFWAFSYMTGMNQRPTLGL
jgi:hypothetical protein